MAERVALSGSNVVREQRNASTSRECQDHISGLAPPKCLIELTPDKARDPCELMTLRITEWAATLGTGFDVVYEPDLFTSSTKT